jgi:hypothetical protein
MIAVSLTGLDVAELVEGLSRLDTLSSDVAFGRYMLGAGFAEW